MISQRLGTILLLAVLLLSPLLFDAGTALAQ